MEIAPYLSAKQPPLPAHLPRVLACHCCSQLEQNARDELVMAERALQHKHGLHAWDQNVVDYTVVADVGPLYRACEPLQGHCQLLYLYTQPHKYSFVRPIFGILHRENTSTRVPITLSLNYILSILQLEPTSSFHVWPLPSNLVCFLTSTPMETSLRITIMQASTKYLFPKQIIN